MKNTTSENMLDNPFAFSFRANDPTSDVVIMFERPRKNGKSKKSSASIPGYLLKKVIAGLQIVDRELS